MFDIWATTSSYIFMVLLKYEKQTYSKKNSPAKLLELVSKEHVSEEDLADHVGKVEKLASKELEEIGSSLGLLLVEVPAGD